ncbi:MAG: hypothetical protein AAGH15_24205 [Myxococcota bacterium]
MNAPLNFVPVVHECPHCGAPRREAHRISRQRRVVVAAARAATRVSAELAQARSLAFFGI